MPDILNTAVSGLLSFQRALNTTSHNIANVNTPGYSRQTVEFGTNNPSFFGGNFYGNGVQIEGISRSYDQFLTREVRDTTSAYARVAQFRELASRIDDVLADPNGGISPILQDFFEAAQDIADDPASSTARYALINTAQTLASRFDSINTRFEQLERNTTGEIRNVVDEINSLITRIRDINVSLNDLAPSAASTQRKALDR